MKGVRGFSARLSLPKDVYMKRILAFFSAAMLCGAFGVLSQNKINPMGVMILDDYVAGKHTFSGSTQAPVYAALVCLEADCDAQDLRDAGFDVVTDLGDIVTVDLPLDRASELSELPQVKYVSFGTGQNINMKFARAAGNVDAAQSGFNYGGETLKFDGTGVIAGLMDSGMDANHVNFTTDNETRVERLWWFRGTNGTAVEYKAETLSAFVTDDASESHATHVAGIMAGSYKGNGQVAQYTSPSGGSMSVGAASMPYYGVATGARLAFSVGALSDANIINGVSKIMDYAQSQGAPCVVNMSLGSNFGPHDGTTEYNRALERLGEKGIICMSAGNEGGADLFVSKEFTSDDNELKTMLNPSMEQGTVLPSGIVDVWGKTDKQLTVYWGVYDAATRNVTRLAQITAVGQSVSINSGNTTFNASFTGSITMASEVNPLNNRFHVQCTLSTITRRSTANNRYLALVVQGSDGEAAYVYGNSNTTFTSGNAAGWEAGSPDCSINDGACGKNVVSVGSFNSALYFPTLASKGYGYNTGSLNGISSFSSYGSTFQGVAKPDVTAPGSVIISSYSRYYYSANKLSTADVSASAVRAGITNYWGQMQGTSMSCPFVSGVVALWLQADPSLKYDDVMDIIKKTSSFNSLTMRPAEKWGAGKIDAVAGLKEILDRSAIGTVWADSEERLILTPTADGYEVFVAAVPRVDITLYTIGGMIAAKSGAEGSVATVSTSGLAKGVYLLTVDSEAGRFTRRVLVK